jgi:hypothetical protein
MVEIYKRQIKRLEAGVVTRRRRRTLRRRRMR